MVGGPSRRWRPGRGGPLVVRLAWSVVPLFTLGIFAWVPILRWAVHRRSRTSWISVGVYFAGAVAAVVCAELGNRPDSTMTGIGLFGGFISLTLMGVGAVQAWVVFGHGYFTPLSRPRRRSRLAAMPPGDPGTQGLPWAASDSHRRLEARALVIRDPATARDLKIGRPDLAARTYDDGGLVDVNHVPGEVLRTHLNWSGYEAAAVVAHRETAGPFVDARDLSASVPGSAARVKAAADLLVFIPD